MDDKKKNLTPELKQIYERVMNTPSGARTNPNVQASTQTPTTPPATPTTPIQASQTVQTPSITQSTQPQMPPIPAPTGPSVAPAQTTPPQPAQGVSFPTPQPISPNGNFVFTGKNNGTAPASAAPGQVLKKSGIKLSGPIVTILVGVLVIAWGIFWATFFGFF